MNTGDARDVPKRALSEDARLCMPILVAEGSGHGTTRKTQLRYKLIDHTSCSR